MSSIRQPKIFNHPQCFIEGWYWAIPSRQLRIGNIKPVTLQGKELAIARLGDGQIIVFDAYCPHMGHILPREKWRGMASVVFFIIGSLTHKENVSRFPV